MIVLNVGPWLMAAADTIKLWSVPVVAILVGVVLLAVALAWDVYHGD